MSPIFANILGPDALIVVGIIVLLFGGSQLPKLARSLGSAKSEFEKGQGGANDNTTDTVKTEPKIVENVVVSPPTEDQQQQHHQ